MAPELSTLINRALPQVEAEFDDTILRWAGWDRRIDVRILNLRLRDDDGNVIGEVPEVAFSISGRALVRGLFAPSSIEFFGPTIRVVRNEDGSVSFGSAGTDATATGVVAGVLRRLVQPFDPDQPLSYLAEFGISQADVLLEDRKAGRTWIAPQVRARVSRENGGIRGEADFLLDMDGAVADLSVVGTFDPEARRIDAGVTFDDLVPSTFSGAAPAFEPLRALEVPIQGTVTMTATLGGQLETVGFDISGKGGRLTPPAPVRRALNVSAMSAVGHYDARTGDAVLGELEISFLPGAELSLGEPVDHDFPFLAISVRELRYDAEKDRMTLGGATLDLDGVYMDLTGTATGVAEGAAAFDLAVAVDTVPASRLDAYWPRSMLTDTYDWAIPHIPEGTVNDLQVDFTGTMAAEGGLELTRADGRFDLAGVKVVYFEGLPPVEQLQATAEFDRHRIDFDIAKGMSAGMEVGPSTISIDGIQNEDQFADVKVALSGPFRDALEIVDKPPLGFARDVGIDPGNTSGTAVVDLDFYFLLAKDLSWDQVDASAKAVLRDVMVSEGLLGLDVSGGQLDLAVDTKGMDVSGEARLGEIPAIVRWRENFDESAETKSTYDISGTVSDVGHLVDLGLDVRPFSGDVIQGDVRVDLNVREDRNGNLRMEVAADLSDAAIELEKIAWRKESGVQGTATAQAEFRDGLLTAIPSFDIETENLVLRGSATYAEDGTGLKRIDFDRIRLGRTDMRGLLIPRADGLWDADFSGPSFNIAPFWEDIVYGEGLSDDAGSPLANLSLSARFDTVWFPDGRAIRNLNGAFIRTHNTWRTIFMTADVGSEGQLEVKLSPSTEREGRVLSAWSNDAGATLAVLDLYDRMVGGELSLTGVFDDTQSSQPLDGDLQISNFRIIKAPALTQILSYMALTGILEALQGEGLAFSQLRAPITYSEGLLTLDEARASGTSLGFTATGKVYTHADAVDVSGTVVPAYVINSALGKLPLVGALFSGGEEGGGVFAARYTMSGLRSDPDVTVNPLSALAPGFLRNVFDVFSGVDDENDSRGLQLGSPNRRSD